MHPTPHWFPRPFRRWLHRKQPLRNPSPEWPHGERRDPRNLHLPLGWGKYRFECQQKKQLTAANNNVVFLDVFNFSTKHSKKKAPRMPKSVKFIKWNRMNHQSEGKMYAMAVLVADLEFQGAESVEKYTTKPLISVGILPASPSMPYQTLLFLGNLSFGVGFLWVAQTKCLQSSELITCRLGRRPSKRVWPTQGVPQKMMTERKGSRIHKKMATWPGSHVSGVSIGSNEFEGCFLFGVHTFYKMLNKYYMHHETLEEIHFQFHRNIATYYNVTPESKND